MFIVKLYGFCLSIAYIFLHRESTDLHVHLTSSTWWMRVNNAVLHSLFLWPFHVLWMDKNAILVEYCINYMLSEKIATEISLIHRPYLLSRKNEWSGEPSQIFWASTCFLTIAYPSILRKQFAHYLLIGYPSCEAKVYCFRGTATWY